MGTVCLGGVENHVSYVIYEEEGEYIAKVDDKRQEVKSQTFPKMNTAKKWVSRMIDVCCREQDEIDRFS